jgi:type IV pilus assembly protein PilC
MSLYIYKASDKAGRRKTGSVQAQSKAAALSLLKDQGLYVVSIVEKRDSPLAAFNIFNRVRDGDVVAFTRQFSTMMSSGLSMSRALDVLASQSSSQLLRKIVREVLQDVEGGASLSSSLSKHPKVFDTTYQALVSAGEASGKLDVVLNQLADNLEASRNLKAKFKTAMIYPTLVVFAMVGVFVLMMVVVIPQLADMYESMNVDLPVMTQVMISASDFMVDNLILVAIVSFASVFGIRYFIQTPTGGEYVSFISFKLPVFGKINKKKQITEFTRTLAMLIGAAIPIVDALKIVANVVTNLELRRATLEAASIVEKGSSLSDYLISNKLYPPLVGQMAKVGEETGKMDTTLEDVADYLESEVNHAVDGLSAALEPLILIMLGGMVGLLIVSIITPIYQITSAL